MSDSQFLEYLYSHKSNFKPYMFIYSNWAVNKHNIYFNQELGEMLHIQVNREDMYMKISHVEEVNNISSKEQRYIEVGGLNYLYYRMYKKMIDFYRDDKESNFNLKVYAIDASPIITNLCKTWIRTNKINNLIK